VNEFARIADFVSAFTVAPSPRGPGDDAAVVGREVVTTDALFENVHFRRATFSYEDIGHKALAVNLSDLAAMGARPRWFVCSLGLPPDVGTAQLRRVARGMAALARLHDLSLVGGNVSRAKELSITITAAGETARPLLRSTAREGDQLFVSGPLGDAAAGLKALSRGQRAPRLVAAQRRPAPHLAWAHHARPTLSAGIDCSDGLLQDLGHLAAASHLAANIELAQVPVSEALLRFAGSRERALEYALNGGEDYVLIVSVAAKSVTHFTKAMERAHLAAFPIGQLLQGSGVTVNGGQSRKRSGFMHFR
jgi:thiamine-monophosphate kinase